MIDAAASLSREELETLLPYRLSEAAIVAAKAQAARRKADRLREDWRRESTIVAALCREAKRLGERDGFRGPAYADAHASAHARRGYARDREKLYLRAEKEAQALERTLRRANAGGRE